MKLLNSSLPMVSVIAALSFSACSNDNDDNLPNNNVDMAELSIKASAVTGNSNTGRNSKADINISTFKINIKEIEFEFDVNTNPDSELFGKTILIEDTINNTPFVFWHNFEVDFEIDYEDNNQTLDISNGFNSVIIEFNLVGLFSTVNLSNATDNDGDGIIEISPSDKDGNRNLANQMKERIKDYAALLDDL